MITFGFLVFFCSFYASHGFIPYNFTVGFLENATFQYVQQNKPISNNTFLLQFFDKTQFDLTTQAGFVAASSALSQFVAIIGLYDYALATICVNLSIPFIVTSATLRQDIPVPPAVLDYSVSLYQLGGGIQTMMNTKSWPNSIRFISDSSRGAYDVLGSLSNIFISECNFGPNDNAQTILQCYQTNFQSYQANSFYVFVTSSSNTNFLDLLVAQTLVMSLQYRSIYLFAMDNADSIMVKYRFCGASLYTIRSFENPIASFAAETQAQALTGYSYIISQLGNYKPLNATEWIYNGVMSQYSRSTILNLLPPLSSRHYQFYSIKRITSATTPILLVRLTYATFWTMLKLNADPNTASTGLVTLAYYLDPLYLNQTVTSLGAIFSGYTNDLITALLVPIQIGYAWYNVNPGAPQILGRIGVNSISGLMTAMQQSAGDMTAFPVPVVKSYNSMFSYTNQIYSSYYSILFKRSQAGVNFFLFLQPFSYIVWLILIGTIIVVSVILWLTNKVSPNVASETEKLDLSNSVFFTVASFLIAKILVKPTMISTQLFYIILWLGTLLLIASYVGNLAYMLTFQKNDIHTITTLQSLLNSSYQWAFVNNSAVYYQILSDQENNVQSLIRTLFERASQSWNPYLLNNTSEVPDFLFKNPNYGVINDDNHNLIFSLNNSSFILVTDTTTVISYAFLLQSNFSFQNILAKQIIQLRESGFLGSLENKYFKVGPFSTQVQTVSKVSSLTISLACGAFALIAIGIIISIPVSVFEFGMHKLKLDCQRCRTGSSLVFNKIYRAKVTFVDKKGIMIDLGNTNPFSRSTNKMYYIPKALLGRKREKDEEAPSPTEQGIMVGTRIYVQYLGNSPEDSKRKFKQVFKD